MSEPLPCSVEGCDRGAGSRSGLCKRHYNAKWVAENPEQARASRRARSLRSRQRDPERHRAACRAWRERNLERERERNRRYRQEHIEAERADDRARYHADPSRTRLWAQSNPEKRRGIEKKWRDANPDKVLEFGRRWAEANPERKREIHRRWVEAHPDQARDATRARKARLRNAFVAPVLDQDIFERDRWICQLCGSPVDPSLPRTHQMGPTIDHRIPISRGGSHEPGNVQLAHWQCNTRKHARLDFGIDSEEAS